MSLLEIAGFVAVLAGHLACFAIVVGGVAGVLIFVRKRLGFDDE